MAFDGNCVESFLKIINSSFPEIFNILYRQAVNKKVNPKIVNLIKAYYKQVNNDHFSLEVVPNSNDDEIFKINKNPL